MAVSSVPAHLSRETSDYAWPLWRAVPPAVATCTAKSRPPPLHSPSSSLKPCQRHEPVYLHRCSPVIYYTSIVMKTYLIHNVYCRGKMACQPKEQTITAALTKNIITIIWWSLAMRAKHVDGKGVFLFRAALLICKAHVNAGSVTCHLRGSKSTSRVAFCICWSSFRSARALVGGSETDRLFFCYQLAVILFIPLI